MSQRSRTVDQFITDELTKHEKAWLAGDYRSMVEGFLLCTWNNRPLPEWIAEAVLVHLEAGYIGQKAPVGRGRKGNPAARERENAAHRTRWGAARTWYGMKEHLPRWGHPASWEGAFAMASEQIVQAKSDARGSWEAVRDSYNLVQRAIRDGKGLQFGIDEGAPGNSENLGD